MKSSRIPWIDSMKAVCILFVMLCHLDCAESIPEGLYTPFFLTGFLFTAGYVYWHEPSFSVFFRKKLRGLMLPWLIFSVGNILLSQVFSFQIHGSVWEELKWNFLQIRGQGDGLWFVAALFVAFLPFYFLIRFYETAEVKYKSAWLCAITWLLSLASVLYTKFAEISALPWHLEYAFEAVFFMTLGYLSRVHNIQPKVWWTGAGYLLLLLPTLLKISLPLPLELLHFYAVQILGVFTLMGLCRKLPESRILSCVGSNTLVCFALHGKVMSVLQWALGHLAIYRRILEHELLSAILAIILTLAMAAILLIPIWVINRRFPFLLGRKGRDN